MTKYFKLKTIGLIWVVVMGILLFPLRSGMVITIIMKCLSLKFGGWFGWIISVIIFLTHPSGGDSGLAVRNELSLGARRVRNGHFLVVEQSAHKAFELAAGHPIEFIEFFGVSLYEKSLITLDEYRRIFYIGDRELYQILTNKDTIWGKTLFEWLIFTEDRYIEKAISMLKEEGILTDDFLYSTNLTPFDSIDERSQRNLIYRAAGTDFDSVKTLLKEFPEIDTVWLIDGYVWEDGPDFLDGRHRYNLRSIEEEIRKNFVITQPIIPYQENLSRAQIMINNRVISINFLNDNALYTRDILGIQMNGATISFTKLPGHYGELSNEPSYAVTVASDIKSNDPGNMVIATASYWTKQSLKSNGLKIKRASRSLLSSYVRYSL